MTDTKAVFTQPFTCYTRDTGGIVFEWFCLECGGSLAYYGDHIDGAREMFARYAPRHDSHEPVQTERRLPYLIERAAQVLLNTHGATDGTVPLHASDTCHRQAEDLARAGLLDGISRHHTWTFEEVPEARYGVHAEHCCVSHGCKYHYRYGPNCPVVKRLVEQAYPCEQCEDEAAELAIHTS